MFPRLTKRNNKTRLVMRRKNKPRKTMRKNLIHATKNVMNWHKMPKMMPNKAILKRLWIL